MTVTGKGDNARYDIQKHQWDNEILLASVYEDWWTNSGDWNICIFWWNVGPRLNTQKYHLYIFMIHNIMCICLFIIYTHICLDTHTYTNRYKHIQDVIGYRSSINFMETTHPGLSNRPKISSSNPSLVGGQLQGCLGQEHFWQFRGQEQVPTSHGWCQGGYLGVKDFQSRWALRADRYDKWGEIHNIITLLWMDRKVYERQIGVIFIPYKVEGHWAPTYNCCGDL